MSKDILTLAREAGFLEHEGTLYTNHKFGDCFGELERLAELVRADERETCAKVADGYIGADPIAEAIRARGNT